MSALGIELDEQFDTPDTKIIRSAARKELAALKERITELEEEDENYNQIYRAVIAEKCPTDEMHCTCVPHLRRRITELEAEREWRPIERAPRDGTEILLWDGICVSVGYCYADSYNTWFSSGNVIDPTHWLPLPPFPEEK